MADERSFERLAAMTEIARREATDRAPAKLKSRIYSAMINTLASDGPLLSLSATKSAGGRLCLFEQAVALAPVGERVKQKNPCRVCHARVLGERMEQAPIFWPACPYSDFHNGG